MKEVLISQSWTRLDSGNPKLDIEALCSMPRLQSIYAETLRLYTSLFALRSNPHGTLELGDFKIPRDELVAVDSRCSAMDSNVWNTGSNTKFGNREELHPVNHFWAERFLVYAEDPNSGPLRFNQLGQNKAFDSASSSHIGTEGPQFTTDGLAGAWLPYGGGNRQCPARNFAKREIIVGYALLFSMLEIELLEVDGEGPRKPDMKYYGLGTLPPKGKVPFRFRRRE